MSRTPALFVAHGAPPLAEDPVWTAELSAWGKALGKPKAILVVSAHWEANPPTLGSRQPVPLIYDFYGFPEHYYRLKYPCPGAPEVAERVRTLLQRVADDSGRGLDHGVYMPLLFMYPQADVPVLQLSLPTLQPAPLMELGRALAPLREEGVMIMGSGFLTHNLRMGFATTPPPWARDFDDWIAEVLQRQDWKSLVDFEKLAPGAALAHPRTEHLAPLFVAAGAGMEDAVSFPIHGFWFGGFSKRSVQFGLQGG